MTILGPTNLPSEVPYHASQMFSGNVTAFLLNLVTHPALWWSLTRSPPTWQPYALLPAEAAVCVVEWALLRWRIGDDGTPPRSNRAQARKFARSSKASVPPRPICSASNGASLAPVRQGLATARSARKCCRGGALLCWVDCWVCGC